MRSGQKGEVVAADHIVDRVGLESRDWKWHWRVLLCAATELAIKICSPRPHGAVLGQGRAVIRTTGDRKRRSIRNRKDIETKTKTNL